MQKKLVISILFLAFISVNCNEKESDSKDNKKAISQIKIDYKNGDKYTLKYGFTQGLVYNYKTSTNSENSQSNGRETQTMKMNTEQTIEIIPNETDSDNEMDLKVKFKTIKMNAEIGNQKFSYDSENPADSSKADSPEFAEYAIFKNTGVSVRVSQRGEIIEVYRLDNIINKILGDKANTVGDEIKSQLKTRLEMQVTSTLQQLFQFLPTEPVNINSDWSKETSEQMENALAKTTVTYKIMDIKNVDGKDVAIINATLASNIEKRKNVEEKGVKYDFKKPQISGKGEVEFNLENGLVVSRNLEVSIVTGMKMSKGYESMDITNRAKNKSSVTLEIN